MKKIPEINSNFNKSEVEMIIEEENPLNSLYKENLDYLLNTGRENIFKESEKKLTSLDDNLTGINEIAIKCGNNKEQFYNVCNSFLPIDIRVA